VKLSNNFSQETRVLFIDIVGCMRCNRSDRGLELHHILGRRSKSKFSAIVLCKECHGHIGHTQEEERELFELTFNYLQGRGLTFIEEDDEFLRDNSYLLVNFYTEV
jgi:hypothetical protein